MSNNMIRTQMLYSIFNVKSSIKFLNGLYSKQASRHIGLQSHASWIEVIILDWQDILEVAHLKENTFILLENKTKTP